MTGWMPYGLLSFSKVFQLYKDDGWVIMESCVQWNPVYDLKFKRSSPQAELESGTARSADQRLQPTELPGLLAEQYPLFNFQNKCGGCWPIFSLQHTGGESKPLFNLIYSL